MTDSNTFIARARAAAAWMAQPGAVFYALPPLMVLLVCGTVAQRSMGLYAAQNMFFSSFILWLGPLPLPGGYSLMAFIGLSMLIKFLFYSEWSLEKAGINLAHLGILVLLAGGLMTGLRAEEGFMVIPENRTSSTVSDYNKRELSIVKNGEPLATVPHKNILTKNILKPQGAPFTIEIRQACRNCKIIRREAVHVEYELPFRDMARFMALTPIEEEKEDEANLYGATISIKGADEEYEGIYTVFDIMPNPVVIEKDGVFYSVRYRKEERPLPFSIRLSDFEQSLHPGSDKASAYHSDVILIDGESAWPVRIEMNKPLRYRGYTFFQSSFTETASGTATILAVVKNGGWLFPYIGTAIIAAGLLLHTLITAFARRREP